MLRPEYLEVCADDLVSLYRLLDISILKLIAKRIAKTNFVGESSRWQAEKLQEAGLLYDEIIRLLGAWTGKPDKELERLFKEAGVETIAADNEIYTKAGLKATGIKQSAAMTQLLRAGLKKTGNTLRNLTMTTAVTAQTAYISACDLAYMQVSSGATSLPDAVRRAVKSAARQGTTVLYPSGHVDQLDIAVRRATLTGVNQTCAGIQLANAESLGCNHVETTAHIGARPSHAEWQGKVFMINGSDKDYKNLAEATGYGTGEGLCGWNCRHNFFPYFPGISTPAYDPEYVEKLKSDGYYEKEQQQRTYERKIRQTRRELAGYDSAIKAAASDEEAEALRQEFAKASVKLKKQEKTLRDYCKENGLVLDSSRVQTHYGKGTTQGFDRSVSQKAVWANRKELQSGGSGGTIYTDSGNGNGFYQVTKEALDRVPFIPISENEEINKRFQTSVRDFLWMVMDFNAAPKTEFSAVYDLEAKQIGFYRRGGLGHVKMDDPNQPYYALHNHGSDKTLSFQDIRSMFKKKNQMSISAIGNRGSFYGLFKTKRSDIEAYNNYLSN